MLYKMNNNTVVFYIKLIKENNRINTEYTIIENVEVPKICIINKLIKV